MSESSSSGGSSDKENKEKKKQKEKEVTYRYKSIQEHARSASALNDPFVCFCSRRSLMETNVLCQKLILDQPGPNSRCRVMVIQVHGLAFPQRSSRQNRTSWSPPPLLALPLRLSAPLWGPESRSTSAGLPVP